MKRVNILFLIIILALLCSCSKKESKENIDTTEEKNIKKFIEFAEEKEKINKCLGINNIIYYIEDIPEKNLYSYMSAYLIFNKDDRDELLKNMEDAGLSLCMELNEQIEINIPEDLKISDNNLYYRPGDDCTLVYFIDDDYDEEHFKVYFYNSEYEGRGLDSKRERRDK